MVVLPVPSDFAARRFQRSHPRSITPWSGFCPALLDFQSPEASPHLGKEIVEQVGIARIVAKRLRVLLQTDPAVSMSKFSPLGSRQRQV